MSAKPAKPRKTPCATCPYRSQIASGIWAADEYDKLPQYDGDIPDQTSAAVFSCHQADGTVCSGWLGHRDHPTDLLAVRIGLIDGRLDPECADYSTTVPLFATGEEAAAHGKAEITDPGDRARSAIDKLSRPRNS